MNWEAAIPVMAGGFFAAIIREWLLSRRERKDRERGSPEHAPSPAPVNQRIADTADGIRTIDQRPLKRTVTPTRRQRH